MKICLEITSQAKAFEASLLGKEDNLYNWRGMCIPDGLHAFPSNPPEFPEVNITIGMPYRQNATLEAECQGGDRCILSWRYLPQ